MQRICWLQEGGINRTRAATTTKSAADRAYAPSTFIIITPQTGIDPCRTIVHRHAVQCGINNQICSQQYWKCLVILVLFLSCY